MGGQNQTEVIDLSAISTQNPTGNGNGGKKGGKKRKFCSNGDYPECPSKHSIFN